MVAQLARRKESRQKAFAIEDPDSFKEAFELLPMATKKPLGRLVWYTHIDFRKAPKWEQVAPYRQCLAKILELTNGINFTQVTGVSAMKAFVDSEGYEVLPQEPNEGIYRLRAMISQLHNHKQTGRKIPSYWEKKFFMVYDKVVVEEDQERVQVPNTHPVLPMAQY